MLKRFFARLFGRRTTPEPERQAPPSAVSAAARAPSVAPPPPPPPPPPRTAPQEPAATPEEPIPVPADEVAGSGAPPEGHVRLILSDGTVVDPPVDADFEERLRYLSDNVLKRRNRPTT